MRYIAIDARVIRQPLDGIGRYTLNLLHGLVDLAPDRRFVLLTQASPPLPARIADSSLFDIRCIDRAPTAPADQLRLPSMLKRADIELLHSADAFTPAIPLLSKHPRTIVTIHDVIPILCRAHLRRSTKARFAPLWRAWLSQQVRSAAAVATVSAHSAQDLSRVLGVAPERVHVIPNAVAPWDETSADAMPKDAPSVLFVGRRDPYKNLAGLVRAFAEAQPKLPADAQLRVAGAPDPRYREAEALAEQLGLRGRVVFLGALTDAELDREYRRASAVALPSYYGGFGLPVLEAMSRGTPVIASNRAALPEVVGDAGLVVDPDAPGGLAEAMVRILTDGALAADLSRRGQQRAAQFTCAKQAERALELYAQLLGEG